MFMHLADYDEQLCRQPDLDGGQPHRTAAWPGLTEHVMETVIQVCLRNEFETIQQYNEFAGELGGAFPGPGDREFPGRFHRGGGPALTSIVTAGARCGIYTIISTDPRQPMPRDFQFSDLERYAFSLARQARRPVRVGARASSARSRSWIAAPPGTLHGAGPRGGLPGERRRPGRGAVRQRRRSPAMPGVKTAGGASRLPLGRAGATKLQFLRLGQGTSQHVLIAGKTGSGNDPAPPGGRRPGYSPDELEFYLIDFKKGVEFKAYARWSCPTPGSWRLKASASSG